MGFASKGGVIAVGAAVAAAAVFWLVTPGSTPLSAASPEVLPRVAGKPDFNGIWEANNTANWDLQAHAADVLCHRGAALPAPVGAPDALQEVLA